MTAPNDESKRKVRVWIAFADQDMVVARHTLALQQQCPFRLVAYHAQQCAEKCLKAWLVHRGIDFPYTHNISRLLELCAKTADWAGQVTDAEELTPFAITTRYPGEDEPVTRAEAQRAVAIAAQVRDVVVAALTAEGVNTILPEAAG